MADVGPPTRVVPVSMAAYDAEPEVRLTELPLTESPAESNHQHQIRRKKHAMVLSDIPVSSCIQ